MKRFISALVVVMMILAMSTVAFATAVHPGDTATVSFTVTGEFGNVALNVNVASGLTITGFGNVTGNTASGMVAWANSENVTSHTFTVTVKVSENAGVGSYPVSASVISAYKYVGVENDTDDIADGWMATSVSVSGGDVLVISCDHAWGEWTVTEEATCTEAGEQTRTCSKCGEVETQAIAALGHNFSEAWEKNDEGHWHKCTRCDAVTPSEAHFWHWEVDRQPDNENQINGQKHKHCQICRHNWGWTDIPYDTDDEGDDMTFDLSVAAYGIVAMISMVASAAFVTKRKSV